jgi:hypothetical protein
MKEDIIPLLVQIYNDYPLLDFLCCSFIFSGNQLFDRTMQVFIYGFGCGMSGSWWRYCHIENILFSLILSIIRIISVWILHTFLFLLCLIFRSQHNRHHAMPQKLDHDVDLNTLPLGTLHTQSSISY